MEVSSPLAYHSSSSHYDDDDVMSSSSYNVPVSNKSGSTVTTETLENLSPRTSGTKRSVRDMIKLFERSTPTTTTMTTTVHRPDSSMFTSSVPYYTGAARGSTIKKFGGSQASVKQYVAQMQEADEQAKANDRCRCNPDGTRGVISAKQYVQQFSESEEQSKTPVKCRSCNGTGCEVSIASRGSTINTFGGSHASVKQYVAQIQEADEQAKVNDRCRCNAGVISSKHYVQQFSESEDQNKTPVKCRSCNGTGCEASFGFGASQTSLKSPFLPQLQDGDVPVKMTERCPRCNKLYCTNEIQYNRANKKGFTVPGNELDCNNGSNKPGNGLKLGPYASFTEGRNNDMLRSSSKEPWQSKKCETLRSPTNLTEQIEGLPVPLIYDSKTTIFDIGNGVRIVVDIILDNMSASDVISRRVETDTPPSRILKEFQQKYMMSMGREDNQM